LSDAACQLLAEWKTQAKKTAGHELIFSTVSGKPISPNNILRRWVWPACEAARLRQATWLTFRRTYSSWAHDRGVPRKVVAQLMGHAKVDTTLNVYTQVLDGAMRAAADLVGSELCRNPKGRRRILLEKVGSPPWTTFDTGSSMPLENCADEESSHRRSPQILIREERSRLDKADRRIKMIRRQCSYSAEAR
jgi:hypothetical protein